VRVLANVEQIKTMGGTSKSQNAARQIDDSVECVFGDLEIPSKDWVSFLESFSHQHEGWLVSISVTHGREKIIGVINCRLQRITLSQSGDQCRLYIYVLRKDGDPVVHLVPDPLRVIFKRDPTGAHQGLEITSGDGRVTVLRFRVAAHPETLDGVLPDFAHNRSLREESSKEQ
jgi:hypothetical protein